MAEVPTFRPQVGGTNLRNVQGVDAVGLRAEAQLSQQIGAFFAGELEIINQKEDEKAQKLGAALGAEMGRNTTSLEDLAGNLQTTDTLLAERLNNAAVTTFMDNSSSSFNQKMSAAEAESPLNAAAFNNTMSSYLNGVSQSIPEDVRPLLLELSNKKIAARSKNIEQRQMRLSLEQSVESYSRSVEVLTSDIAKAQLEGNQDLADSLDAELQRTMASARASGIIASDEALKSEWEKHESNIRQDELYFKAIRSDDPYKALDEAAKSGDFTAEETVLAFNRVSSTINQLNSAREQSEDRAKKEKASALSNYIDKIYTDSISPDGDGFAIDPGRQNEIKREMSKLGASPKQIEDFMKLMADPPEKSNQYVYDELDSLISDGAATKSEIQDLINYNFKPEVKNLTLQDKLKLQKKLETFDSRKTWFNFEPIDRKINAAYPVDDIRDVPESMKADTYKSRVRNKSKREEVWNALIDRVESGKGTIAEASEHLNRILASDTETVTLSTAINRLYPNDAFKAIQLEANIRRLSAEPGEAADEIKPAQAISQINVELKKMADRQKAIEKEHKGDPDKIKSEIEQLYKHNYGGIPRLQLHEAKKVLREMERGR